MRSCFLAFLCLLFLAAGTARGVEIDAFFLGLDIRDDLPQDTVHAVLRDSRGFLWVATQGGLARWDGYRMRVFRRDPASVNSLPGNDIVALAEGRDGRIWVGTLYAGVAAIAPESGYIERFGRARGLASDRITTMAVAPDGAIWLGHPGSGLSRIDPASDSASTYASGLGVSGLTAVEDGLWVAGPGGLGFMPWDADQPEPVSLDPAPSPGEHLGMYAVDATPGWPVAVAASTGLWLQNPDTGVFHQRVLRKPGEGGVGLTDVLRVPDGTLWVSTDSGLWRVSADGEQAEPVTAASERSRLPDYPLQTLHYDDQGLLWIGTDNAGLWRMIRPPDGIHLRQLRYQEQSPLVWAAEAHDGLLWLGTVEHGLLAFGDDDEPEAAYLLDAETDVGDSIWGLASGKSGLWVGTRPVALYRVQDGRLEEHPKVMASVDHVRADAILDLMEDSDGHVWIATNGDGLHRYDPASGEIRAWRAEGVEEHGLGDDRLRRIHQDPEGRLWIGTDGSGLYMRPPGASRFRHIPAGEEGLPGGMIETIRHDSQGNIWVGTYDGGVARLNPWGGIRRITEAEGLPSDSVAGLELDAQDRVWVMTDLGLARIDPDGFVQRFGQAQGVLPFLVHVGSHARGPGNELIFAGEEGLLTVDPVALSSDAVAIEPRVTDVRVMGEPVWAGRTLYQPLTAWQERGLQLSHDQPALSLDYAVADLTDPGHHRYRHRLKGLESDWHYTSGARASATYTNLDPGHYRFELEALNREGEWRGATPMPINVAYPPWMSPQARLAYGLIFMLALGGSFQLWRRRSQREAALQREREQRQWIEQLHELAARLAEPADRGTLLRRFLERLTSMLPIEAASVRLERSGQMPSVRVGVERPGASPVSSQDRHMESLILLTRRRRLGELHVRPERKRPLSERDRAALAAAADQAAQALDMFLLVLEAEAANQAKSAFLAKLSHEIRTPVSGMLGLAGLLLRESLEPGSRDYARAIQSSGQGLMAILSDILDHARIEAGRMEIHPAPFDVVAALEDTLALHAVEASRRGIAVLGHVRRDIPARIISDEVRFRQILGNLVSNAVKFTEAGSVTVELRRHDAGRLCLRVSDTGPGLSQAAADRLFQPFSRAEGSDGIEGTGLGLVICRELARLMGGEIRLDTRPGSGAHFEVVFEAESDGGERPATVCRQTLCLVGADGPALQLLRKRLGECGLVVSHQLQRPEASDEQLVLVVDKQGLHLDGQPEERLDWPLRELRLAEWLDRLSGHAPLESELLTASPQVSSSASYRLLLAEDNPVNARVVSDVLFTAGYQVDVVVDGEEALKSLDGNRYDLVLMDRHMPRLDGLSAVRRIRQSAHRDVPVIGLTAAVSPEEHADCCDAGMDRVVVKDGDPGPMLKAIREALDGLDGRSEQG